VLARCRFSAWVRGRVPNLVGLGGGRTPAKPAPAGLSVKKPGPGPNLMKTWGQLDLTEDPLRPVLGYFCPGPGLR